MSRHICRPERQRLLRQTLWLMGGNEHVDGGEPGALAHFVGHHGVAGLLQPARLQALDAPSRQSLALEQRTLALRALQLGGALRRLVPLLERAGVDVLPLKGPTLAVQAYGSMTARGGVDLDLLVAEAHWPRALAVLRQEGYAPADERCLPLPEGTHELVLRHSGALPALELHRRLLRRRHAARAFEQQTHTVDLQGVALRALHPTSAFPYLVAHASQHCFRRLIWLADLEALLRREDLDHAALARQFQRSASRGVLDTCLALLEALFGAEIQGPLAQARRACPASRHMTDTALQALTECLTDAQVAERQGRARRVMIDIGLQDDFPARWQALLDWLAPTGRDSRWLRLPAALSPLYPLVRFARLVTRR